MHSNNCYLAVLDEQLRPVRGRRVAACLSTVLEALAPHQEQIVAIAVESTFNWYWLEDGLMAPSFVLFAGGAPTGVSNQIQGLES